MCLNTCVLQQACNMLRAGSLLQQATCCICTWYKNTIRYHSNERILATCGCCAAAIQPLCCTVLHRAACGVKWPVMTLFYTTSSPQNSHLFNKICYNGLVSLIVFYLLSTGQATWERYRPKLTAPVFLAHWPQCCCLLSREASWTDCGAALALPQPDQKRGRDSTAGQAPKTTLLYSLPQIICYCIVMEWGLEPNS